MIKVKIEDETLQTFKTRNDKTMYSQFGIVELNGEVRRVKFPLKDEKVYPKGNYVLSDDSFYIDKYSSLSVWPRLVIVK